MNQDKPMSKEMKELFKAHFAYEPEAGSKDTFRVFPLDEVELIGNSILELSFKTDLETQKKTYMQLKYMEENGEKFFKLMSFNLNLPGKMNRISQTLSLEDHNKFITENIIGTFLRLDWLFNKIWDGQRNFCWNLTLLALAKKAIEESLS